MSDKDGVLPRLAARGLIGGGFEMSLGHFCAAIAEITEATIVLTDGVEGAYAASDGTVTWCPTLTVEVAGTAGAGDAFASTFAAYSVAGFSIDEALQAATVNAASVISHVGTQTGLLTKSALEQRLDTIDRREDFACWQI